MNLPFPVQWFLEPAPVAFIDGARLVQEQLVDSFSERWHWQDRFGDCTLEVQNGARIHAANGRDLWHLNQSAPRIMTSLSGDGALEVVCRPVSDQKPAIGGLVVWADEGNYLRLDWGMMGRQSILFLGCLDNVDVLIGRGAPSWQGDRRYLRLERIGDGVRALCSKDGRQWFTAGQATLSCEQVSVGLYAAGQIDRALYPGHHRAGAAIAFDGVRLWQQTP
jgi:hypothetical protein